MLNSPFIATNESVQFTVQVTLQNPNVCCPGILVFADTTSLQQTFPFWRSTFSKLGKCGNKIPAGNQTWQWNLRKIAIQEPKLEVRYIVQNLGTSYTPNFWIYP